MSWPRRAAAVFLLPGIVFRQGITLFLCRWLHVPVLDACWFRADRPAPPVHYDPGQRFVPAACLVVVPFVLATLLCAAFCLPGVIALLAFGVVDPVGCLCLWPGLALGLCAVPPVGAVEPAWTAVRRHVQRRAGLAVLMWPVVGLLWTVHRLRAVRADLWSGAVPGIVGPLLLLHWLAG